ncbi:MAG: hypothetical protein ACK4P8_03785 [Tabrizicola sp.]
MSAVAIQQMADRVAQLLEQRLAVGGRDLAAKLRRGGRLLPKRVREGAELLAVSAERAQNPKLLGQIDMGAVAEAYDACVRHLTAIDPASRRKETIAGMVGFVGYGILFLIVAVIAVLVWRGFL